MIQLTLDEARSLAQVFGPLDPKTLILLAMFQRPRSKYDASSVTKKLRKHRIPPSSLYRIVDRLCKTGFLEEVGEEGYEHGDPRAVKTIYGLGLKGMLASEISAIVLYLDPAFSAKERESIIPEESYRQALDTSSTADFLRWHRERGFNLTSARVDYAYFYLVSLLGRLDRKPEEISNPLERRFIQDLKKEIKQSEQRMMGAIAKRKANET